MKLQGFALPLDLSTHWSSVSQFCVRHLIPFHQPRRTKNADAVDTVYALKTVCQKGPNIFWQIVCAMHTVSQTWRDGGGVTLRRIEGRECKCLHTHRFENTTVLKTVYTAYCVFFFTLFKKHWLNQESGFIVARITILYWSHWVLSGEEGRPQQKLNLMYLSAHNQWRHRSAKFSSSSPS